MAVSYGFFNSLNGDRVYSATEFSRLFEGLIKDGVFMSVGEQLIVKPHSGMDILVSTGRAWFNNTWTNNDADYILSIDPSEVALKRIDTVVLEVNLDTNVRANSLKVIKGTPGEVPVAPTLVDTEFVYLYPLANVLVNQGVTSIGGAQITNRVGGVKTPFVTGILDTVVIDDLVLQWNAAFDDWLADQQTEYEDWFYNLQIELDGEVAVNLQNQITAIKADDWVTTIRILDGTITPAKLNTDAFPIAAAGDIVYASAANALTRLQKGSPKQFLKMNVAGNAPEWVTKEDDVLVYLVVFDVTESLKIVDGAKYFTIPPELNGAILINASCYIYSPSTVGVVTVQLARARRTSPTNSPPFYDILTTKMTINQGEYSSTDAVPPVIGSTYRDMLTRDIIRIDVDASGTLTKGLDVGLAFRL